MSMTSAGVLLLLLIPFAKPLACGLDPNLTTSTHNGTYVQQLVDSAVQARCSQVTIPPGSYVFADQNLLVRNAVDLWINAIDVRLVFNLRLGSDTTPPKGYGVRLIECHNVSLVGVEGQELVIDYEPPPYWQGTIQALEFTTPSLQPNFVMAPDPGFGPLPEFHSGVVAGGTMAPTVVAIFWDGGSGLMSLARPAGVHTWQFEANVTDIQLDRCRLPLSTSDHSRKVPLPTSCALIEGWQPSWQRPSVGDKLTIQPRTGITLNIANSSEVKISDVVIRSAPNKAITEFGGKGGHRYSRVTIGRAEGTGRLLAANSDAFHSAGCERGPTLDHCQFGFSGDDFFNIHNTMQVVLDATIGDMGSEMEIRLVEPFVEPNQLALYGPNSAYGTATQFEHANIGMSLSIYLPNNLAHVTTVTLVEAPSGFDVTTEELTQLKTALANRGLSTLRNFAVKGWKVRVRSPNATIGAGAAIGIGMVINMDGWDAHDALISNSQFHDGYCTAGRLKCPHCKVTRSNFTRAVIHTLQLCAQPTFFEGPMRAQNMSFAFNRLEDCGLSPLVAVPEWAPGLQVHDNHILVS